MSEKQNEEKNDNFQKINDNIDNNENKYSKKIINIFENKIEKDDINFDSIDFNINPFKEQKLEDKEQKSESDELVLEEKEDEKFEFNNIQLNSKFHTSNELLKVNFFQEDDEKGKGKKVNNENNLFNLTNNNKININNNNIFDSIDKYNSDSRNSYNNNSNIKFDLDANSFFPRNNNYYNKGKQNWICSYCNNFNNQSKTFLFILIFLYSWGNMQ